MGSSWPFRGERAGGQSPRAPGHEVDEGDVFVLGGAHVLQLQQVVQLEPHGQAL